MKGLVALHRHGYLDDCAIESSGAEVDHLGEALRIGTSQQIPRLAGLLVGGGDAGVEVVEGRRDGGVVVDSAPAGPVGEQRPR